MKVLLVKPYNRSDHIQPSLGLGYLAFSARKGHEVEILDCIKERLKPSDFPRALDRIKPDLVGVQCYTFDLYSIGSMLRECKARGIITVLGGPHPTTAPRETLEFFRETLDFAFQGVA